MRANSLKCLNWAIKFNRLKKYFIHDGSRQLGPFSADELMQRGITKCTPVYTSGMGRYVTASEIPALSNLLSPGNIKCPPIETGVDSRNPSTLKKVVLGLAVLTLVVAAFILYGLQKDVADAPQPLTTTALVQKPEVQQLKTELGKKEASNPLEYLTVHGKMHNNLSGKKIIKGSITNMASIASYRDVHVSVTFLSAAENELATQQFIVNDFVTPNNKTNFRSVFKAPAETAGFRIKVLSAAAMDQ